MYCKKGLLRNFTKFTGKHLCQSLFFNKVAGLRLYIYYWLIDQYPNNDNLKYTAIPQRSFNSFSLFYIFFLSSFSFWSSLFKLSFTKKHHVYILYYISYTLSRCYAMHYIVPEIRIGGKFLKNYFYCYSQEIISAVAEESLIPYNLIHTASETLNL